MKKQNLFFYLTVYLALLVPAPGRFVYGFTLMAELTLLSAVASLSVLFARKIKMEQLKSTIFILISIAFTILFRAVMILINAEVVLTLGFLLFLPPVSLLILNILFLQTSENFLEQFKSGVAETLFFALGGLAFFLIRDIFGYGTFTFFGKNHFIYEKILLNPEKIGIFSLLATIPGALIFLSLCFLCVRRFMKKIDVLKIKENDKG